MKLYSFPGAPFCRKVHLAAYEKGIELELEIVLPFEPGALDQLREALGVPLAQLPLLQLDDGRYVRESSIMVEHFDLFHDGGPQLVPRDPHEALSVRALDRFADVVLQPSSYLVWATRKKEPGPETHRKIEAARKNFWTAMSLLEEELSGGPFLCGDRFTLADISVSCAIGTIESWASLDELAPYPTVQAWFERVLARPAWQRMIEESKPYLSKLPPQVRTAF